MKMKLISVLLICVCFVGLITIEAGACDKSELLTLAVEAVAPDESYTVMVSVASVLLNRVESEQYPMSLAAVIADAGIDISAVTPSLRARSAARDAISGFDPTAGALFYSKGKADPPFIRLKTCAWCFY